jgi:hypothetical protein
MPQRLFCCQDFAVVSVAGEARVVRLRRVNACGSSRIKLSENSQAVETPFLSSPPSDSIRGPKRTHLDGTLVCASVRSERRLPNA